MQFVVILIALFFLSMILNTIIISSKKSSKQTQSRESKQYSRGQNTNHKIVFIPKDLRYKFQSRSQYNGLSYELSSYAFIGILNKVCSKELIDKLNTDKFIQLVIYPRLVRFKLSKHSIDYYIRNNDTVRILITEDFNGDVDNPEEGATLLDRVYHGKDFNDIDIDLIEYD